MTSDPPTIDISAYPDVVALARRVGRGGDPRVLAVNGKEVALIIPLNSRRRVRRRPSAADIAAFHSSAGSWADVDVDTLLENIKESRSQPPKPAVEL